MSKLSIRQIEEIKAAIQAGDKSQKEIAKDYNITEQWVTELKGRYGTKRKYVKAGLYSNLRKG